MPLTQAKPAKMCVIVANTNGMIIAAVGDPIDVCGWRAEELIGKNVRDIVPRRYRTAHDTGMYNYRKTGNGPVIGQVIPIEARGSKGSEHLIWLAVFTYDSLVMAVLQTREEQH